MSIGIYKITNLVNGKSYIGQSVHIEKRWSEHCQPSADSLIGKAIQKYGKTNFNFQIIEECPIEELDTKEAQYINQFNCLVPNGYNIVAYQNGKPVVFNKYNESVLQNIFVDIQKSNLSFQEIAQKYKLDLSMVYYLNRGDYHRDLTLQYPLRPVQNLSKKEHYCLDCGCEISFGAIRCIKCEHIRQRKAQRPTREELKALIRNKTFKSIGSQFNVSDKAITKWCISYNLPSRKKEINQISDQDWLEI